MLVQLPSPSSPSAMSRQTAEHLRLKIRSNEIDNEFAGWERPFAEQEGETGQIAFLCSVSVHRKSSLRMIAVVCAWRAHTIRKMSKQPDLPIGKPTQFDRFVRVDPPDFASRVAQRKLVPHRATYRVGQTLAGVRR